MSVRSEFSSFTQQSRTARAALTALGGGGFPALGEAGAEDCSTWMEHAKPIVDLHRASVEPGFELWRGVARQLRSGKHRGRAVRLLVRPTAWAQTQLARLPARLRYGCDTSVQQNTSIQQNGDWRLQLRKCYVLRKACLRVACGCTALGLEHLQPTPSSSFATTGGGAFFGGPPGGGALFGPGEPVAGGGAFAPGAGGGGLAPPAGGVPAAGPGGGLAPGGGGLAPPGTGGGGALPPGGGALAPPAGAGGGGLAAMLIR